ncbi:MAG TPA: hypothetical protein VFU69_17310 [Ktedonobacterales bacterium]|nr:hypothetical protein [Ktedonobacterales bacterium]
MFDARNPYERHMWHYESDRPLSVAQLIALGSLDAYTAALLWMLIERHTPYIISGPTSPTPGVGKTTTLNAMLDFLPDGTSLVYTSGMFERFDFREMTEPASTCVLCNEVSDHLRIYMWGRVARRFLDLTAEGYAIATSMHADTLDDVLSALMGDLRLSAEQMARLGVIVNIGIVGRVWPPRRRFLTINLMRPRPPAPLGDSDASQDEEAPADMLLGPASDHLSILPLSQWEAKSDCFTHPDAATLAQVAAFLKMDPADFNAALQRRVDCLQTLAEGNGAAQRPVRRAIARLRAEEAREQGADADESDA